MQSLLDTVRATGATNVVLLGGVQYSNNLGQWATYKPSDATGNLGAAWHIYNFNSCASTTCFDGAPAALASTVPIVATEFGENDCQGSIVTPWMTWFDSHGVGYLAWTWNTWSATCVAATATTNGNPWSLITSSTTAAPMPGLGQTIHDHFVSF
jgi:hypothetical protein